MAGVCPAGKSWRIQSSPLPGTGQWVSLVAAVWHTACGLVTRALCAIAIGPHSETDPLPGTAKMSHTSR
jgi:isoaspartyl peptidase/L-asparaginase-like protein (Ntn-hydrolase superfamily)